MVLAPLVGGVLVDLFSYMFIFWICVMIAAVSLLMTLITVEEPRKAMVDDNL